MRRLASSIDAIKDHYTVVVVGSGYGGGIAASRMARAGQDVCVLERGKELIPGEYPNNEIEAAQQLQLDAPEQHIGSHTGLYDLRVNEDINVFVGCGLGGTSLVNANVSLRAEPRVFQDPAWPEEIREEAMAIGGSGQKPSLEKGYENAEEMLKPMRYPDFDLPKLQALKKSADSMRANFDRPPINVTFADGVNQVGVEQQDCQRCGDCVTGCNFGSKNTVLMNYLPDATNHRAEIFTEVSVRYIERGNDKWLVHYQLLGVGAGKFNAPTEFVTADIVILAAGTLGSTEILLRSQDHGLNLSPMLGKRFTGNGDVLGFGYNNEVVINGIGFGAHSPAGRAKVGPCITGKIDLRSQPALQEGMVIEEGAVPGALGALLPVALAAAAGTEKALAAAAGAAGREVSSIGRTVAAKSRELESLVLGPYHGAAHNTQTYLVMTHDGAGGEMYLEDDRLRIRWPGLGDQPIFRKVNETLKRATEALGGTYVSNPIWSELLRHELITVHPLGGCVMGDTAATGVVNHKSQVFNPTQKAPHPGLYVCDGAIVPRSLGVNPLLTISALAERSVALLAQDRGWTIDYTLPSASQHPLARTPLGLEFTEKMAGYFSTTVKDDFERAAEQGQSDGSVMQFIVTIRSDNLDEMLTNSNHDAQMVGTLEAKTLSAKPLTITEGTFNLFIKDPTQVETRNMVYQMKLRSEEGKDFFFRGFKVIHDESALNIWRDTTTLYVTVYEGVDATAPVLGMGILRIKPQDLLRQLSTIAVLNASTLEERLQATARFGRFFAAVLFDTYGGIFAKQSFLAPNAPPRKKRALRVNAPETYFFTTPDGVTLCLTRYRGGRKGPVMLAHGLGVSSLIFSIDTIDTNLVEYLFVHEFDVWLLDFRASIEMPASKTQFSGDEIARNDYPAAVQKIKEVTGVSDIQVVAHCFGSTTFMMAMLSGLAGVRSAVCSQIGTNIVAPAATRIKSGLHVPEFLDKLGVRSLTSEATANEGWMNRLYDRALELYPLREHCHSSVCRRISFMYAPLYQHGQLNDATHDALHEMFGLANVEAFEHLALLTRMGHLVDRNGQEVYMPHLDRLRIPICFIHGSDNECFLPESTQRTYELLRATNGNGLYSRHLISEYGHIDCIFGKNAAKDVFPFVSKHLECT